MHICPQEIYAFMLALPFLGYLVYRVSHIWHWIWHRGTPKDDGCCPPGHEETHPETVTVHQTTNDG